MVLKSAASRTMVLSSAATTVLTTKVDSLVKDLPSRSLVLKLENTTSNQLKSVPNFIERAARPWLLRCVSAGTAHVLLIQSYQNVFLDVWWRMVTTLGSEVMYLLMFPFLWWNVDKTLALHLALIWAIGFFLGNSAKDILALPRPPSPPVIRKETTYDNEYGLPSTHALCSFTLPLSMVIYIYQAQIQSGEYRDAIFYGSIALFVCLNVCFSRLYLGVHSPADIAGGLLLGVVILVSWWCSEIGDFLITLIGSQSILVPFISMVVCMGIIACYPNPTLTNPAFVDVVGIWSCMHGSFVGMWQAGYSKDTWTTPMFPRGDIVASDRLVQDIWLLCLLRTVIGCVGVALFKILTKFVMINIMKWLKFSVIAPTTRPGLIFRSQMKNEFGLLATKYASYFMVGLFAGSTLSTALFARLQLA